MSIEVKIKIPVIQKLKYDMSKVEDAYGRQVAKDIREQVGKKGLTMQGSTITSPDLRETGDMLSSYKFVKATARRRDPRVEMRGVHTGLRDTKKGKINNYGLMRVHESAGRVPPKLLEPYPDKFHDKAAKMAQRALKREGKKWGDDWAVAKKKRVRGKK